MDLGFLLVALPSPLRALLEPLAYPLRALLAIPSTMAGAVPSRTQPIKFTLAAAAAKATKDPLFSILVVKAARAAKVAILSL